jgi:hypothetical protein
MTGFTPEEQVIAYPGDEEHIPGSQGSRRGGGVCSVCGRTALIVRFTGARPVRAST